MKCINIYRKEYIKYYNLVVDITKLVKDFLYPNKYSFVRINSSLPVKEQLSLIRKDLESMKFQKEINEEFMKNLDIYFPIHEEQLDTSFLDNLQVYLNPQLLKIKSALEEKYLPFIKRIEIDDFKDTNVDKYSDDTAWELFLKDKDNVDVLEELIGKIIYSLSYEAKDEEIYNMLKNHYKLEEFEFARYIKGEKNEYSSIQVLQGHENKINVNFNSFNIVFRDIYGQDESIEKIRKTLLRSILFYNAEDIGKRKESKTGPLATFMFYGPTGTGKTETAKKMAKFVYGNENKMLILDMNCYKDARVSASSIKGHPEGYVDSGKGTDFTRFLAKNNKGIIVLDEFEKASDEVREIFMSMLDEGSFKDALGNVYDLSGYIFVATTNVSKIFENKSRRIGFAMVDDKEKNKSEESRIRDELREIFTAPILNRFNNIIGFGEITKNDAMLICNDLIAKLIKSLESKRFGNISPHIRIENRDEITEIVLEESNFKKDGVRSLKNVVNDLIGVPILEQIAHKNGEILVSTKDKEIFVSKKTLKDNKVCR